jgi:hypothetical protein
MKTFTATALASATLLSLASAQEQYQINPDSVSDANRQFWCQSQITQCPVSRDISTTHHSDTTTI